MFHVRKYSSVESNAEPALLHKIVAYLKDHKILLHIVLRPSIHGLKYNKSTHPTEKNMMKYIQKAFVIPQLRSLLYLKDN